jgi:hypothetical protein
VKYLKYLGLLFIVSILTFVVTSCRPFAKTNNPPEEEPLLLMDEPLLLVDDGEGQLLSQGAQIADNSRCYVCHINFSIENFAVTHARADISCEHCHGPSDAHCSDEDNITPPDIMYPEEKINPSCLQCHLNGIKDNEEHQPVLAAVMQKNCTSCHDDHKMSHRTRRWNRQTGELVYDDKVRMMDDNMIKKK